MKYDKKKFKENNLAAAKSDLRGLIMDKPVPDAVSQLKQLNSDLNSDPLKSFDLMLQGVRIVSDKIESKDIPSLIDLLENLNYPILGGEERATYFRIFREVSEKLNAVTGIAKIENITPSQAEIVTYIEKVKTWSQDNIA